MFLTVDEEFVCLYVCELRSLIINSIFNRSIPCPYIGLAYYFMLNFEFDLSEKIDISGRVTMNALRIRGCPSVCRQIKLTSIQRVTSLFSIFIHV